MDILQIVTLGLVATILYITLKDINGSFAFLLLLLQELSSLFPLFIRLEQSFNYFNHLAKKQT